MNSLRQRPEWYSALTHNCTTSIRTQRAAADRAPWDWRMLVNGHGDELLYERGVIATNLPLAELKERVHINARARAADKADGLLATDSPGCARNQTMNTHQTSSTRRVIAAARHLPRHAQSAQLSLSVAGPGLALAALLLAGCAAPIGADRVTTRQAYAQVDANALRTGKPSANTVSILHRYDLDRLAARQPDEAVRQLHQKAAGHRRARPAVRAGGTELRGGRPHSPQRQAVGSARRARLLSRLGGLCLAVPVRRREGCAARRV